tara:strand:- start:624 stop:893 length:270 start_codon:yes stop_codon:yes gene_type:complete
MINRIWKYTFAFASICLLILLVFQASSEIHRVEKIITFQDSLTTLNLKIHELKNTIENERINYERMLDALPDSIQPNQNGFMLQSLQKD